jgi:peptidoglycan hydrolase-like protein with peptidoglycan-binding domain/3D (Asp-Asp-Asp) domain-containing protein
MKNKILSFLATFVFVMNFSLLDLTVHAEGAESSAVDQAVVVYPYTKLFGITAYYSPLPGQSKYVTGSYQGDIRLNGRGTNGADGTPVYPGMVAAPRTYPFGTKLYIPGIGLTAVHDRGGAIVEGVGDDGSGPKHDRLDIWMGFGDKGLRRALDWGYRTVEVTVYGIDDSMAEDVIIGDYSDEERYNQEYFYIPEYYEEKSFEQKTVVKEALFPEDLWYLSQGDDVKKLQQFLNQLGYFNGEINGYFGDETRMAIYIFQKDKGLVSDIVDIGAGHFGSATRQALEDAIVSQKNELNPKVNLGPAETDKESVKKLQKALKLAGYDVAVNGSYDSKTVEAVFKFQTDNDIVGSISDSGAGYFGPKTFAVLAKKIDTLFKSGIKLAVAHANDEIGVLISTKQILTPPMKTNLKLGDEGSEVKRLQQELKNLNLLRIEPTGNFGETTAHAVFKFQQIHGLVTDENSQYAGIFGDQTRQKMNEIIAAKNYYTQKIAEKAIQSESVKVAVSSSAALN